jgi:iron complex transport system ATP-binding protein
VGGYALTQSLLELQNVTVMRDTRRALDSLTFSIAEGEHVAILGPNGSGKSTLIKTITRECYPVQGSVMRILGQDRWNVWDLRVLLGIVSNDLAQSCARDIKGREAVLSGFFSSVGLQPYHIVTPEMERKADEVLELMEVPHLADRWMDEVSSGEARRIVIGRALVHDPKALVLDEPTTSLDLRAAWEVHEILRKLACRGITIIMVTHHLPDLIPEIGRAILLKQGRVFYDGCRQDALSPEMLAGLFDMPADVFAGVRSSSL